MKDLTTKLDKVAAALEQHGLKHLAMELDIVSNSLEATSNLSLDPSPEQELNNRWALLVGAVEDLSTSVVGGNKAVAALNRLLQKQRMPLSSADIKLSPEWKGFEGFIRGVVAQMGDDIDEKYLFRNVSGAPAKWSELTLLADIMAPSHERGKMRTETVQLYKKNQPMSDARQKAEGLFKQADAYNDLPMPIRRAVEIWKAKSKTR
jgi:hypothetical protein